MSGEAVAWNVLRIGNYGAAYDSPNTHRAFTYDHQPGNVDASRLGGARNAAAKMSGGDNIDFGLGLLKALQDAGFGVFQIGPEATTPPAAQVQQERCPDCGAFPGEPHHPHFHPTGDALGAVRIDDAMIERACVAVAEHGPGANRAYLVSRPMVRAVLEAALRPSAGEGAVRGPEI